MPNYTFTKIILRKTMALFNNFVILENIYTIISKGDI